MLTNDEVREISENYLKAVRAGFLPPAMFETEEQVAAMTEALQALGGIRSAGLVALARSAGDLGALAGYCLMERGLSVAGDWIGFDRAKEAWKLLLAIRAL